MSLSKHLNWAQQLKARFRNVSCPLNLSPSVYESVLQYAINLQTWLIRTRCLRGQEGVPIPLFWADKWFSSPRLYGKVYMVRLATFRITFFVGNDRLIVPSLCFQNKLVLWSVNKSFFPLNFVLMWAAIWFHCLLKNGESNYYLLPK